ncbi:MAG: hypothetical protein ABJE95_02925 [Byssovorax sp.]
MTSKKAPPEPTTPDDTDAKTAFATVQPLALALAKDKITSPNTTVDAAIIVALAVAREANAAPLRARFESLPKKEFDIANLDKLPLYGRACWYALTQLHAANVQSSEAKLPVILVEKATKTRTRMIKVLEYFYEPDTDVGREVTSIRLDSGYRDLARDLGRLAVVYRAEHDEIKDEKKHFRATDAGDAEKLSQDILDELGAATSAEQKQWTDMVARTWTLLYGAYNDVAATGRWLQRSEGGGELFVSLVTAGRAARSKAKKPGGAEGPQSPPGAGGRTP